MRPGGTSRVPPPEYATEILPDHMPDGLLSIAVFGPGKGEAIVVRLPDGRVGVVDGCREPEPDHPMGRGDPVRELLERLARAHSAPEELRLEFVALTHPHADHYGGVGRLLHAFHRRVDQIWEVAQTTPGFLPALLKWTERTYRRDRFMVDEHVVKGLERIIERFHLSRSEGGSQLKHLSADKLLLERVVGDHELKISACGPADGDLQTATEDLIASLSALKGREGARAGRFDPNLTSGALLVRWGRSAMLLAGDLLRGTAPHSGWELARRRIDGEVQVVNVAHHASVKAHHGDLWAAMRPALAIVTPFMFGESANPPRPEQISALARTEAVVAITSPPAWKDESGNPRPMHPGGSPVRTFGARNTALALTPSGSTDAIRNAVAVSMDAGGRIMRLVLAGQADVYLPPDAAPPRTSSAVSR